MFFFFLVDDKVANNLLNVKHIYMGLYAIQIVDNTIQIVDMRQNTISDVKQL